MKTGDGVLGGHSATDTRQQTILVLLLPGDYGSRMLAGIREYANAVGWHLQTIEY